jgi:excisionase family DNA binding protein
MQNMNETVGFPRIAYQIDDAAAAVGVSRPRIYNAVRDGEITARKAGRATLIEADELRRWIRSLPTRGRAPTEKADLRIAGAAVTV